jgi:hypothetical protein
MCEVRSTESITKQHNAPNPLEAPYHVGVQLLKI